MLYCGCFLRHAVICLLVFFLTWQRLILKIKKISGNFSEDFWFYMYICLALTWTLIVYPPLTLIIWSFLNICQASSNVIGLLSFENFVFPSISIYCMFLLPFSWTLAWSLLFSLSTFTIFTLRFTSISWASAAGAVIAIMAISIMGMRNIFMFFIYVIFLSFFKLYFISVFYAIFFLFFLNFYINLYENKKEL